MSDILEEDEAPENKPNETDNERENVQQPEGVGSRENNIAKTANLDSEIPETADQENGSPISEKSENEGAHAQDQDIENAETESPEIENAGTGHPKSEDKLTGQVEDDGGKGDEADEVKVSFGAVDEVEQVDGEEKVEDEGRETPEEDHKEGEEKGSSGQVDDEERGETTVEEDKGSTEGELVESTALISGMQIAELIVEEILDQVFAWTDEQEEIASVLTIKSPAEEPETDLADAEREEAERQREETFVANVALYHRLVDERAGIKRKNHYLVRKMYEHYKRTKIEHLFREIPMVNVDMEERYTRALTAYQEARDAALEEKERNKALIASLTEKRKEVAEAVKEEFDNFVEKEREVGRNLTCTQTAKPYPDKLIDDMIQRQLAKAETMASTRLVFYKLKEIVSSDETKLKEVETVGENLTLMEYDQLKMHNQNCIEKLEEKEADLSRLRVKATSAIQVLAELREKARATEVDIETEKIVLHDVNMHLIEIRERVGSKKSKRDITRSDVMRLRQEAGLLADPRLLHDHAISVDERDVLSSQLARIKRDFNIRKQKIYEMRKILARHYATPGAMQSLRTVPRQRLIFSA